MRRTRGSKELVPYNPEPERTLRERLRARKASKMAEDRDYEAELRDALEQLEAERRTAREREETTERKMAALIVRAEFFSWTEIGF